MPDTPAHQLTAQRKLDRLSGAQRVVVWVLSAGLPILAGAVGYGHHKLHAHDGDIREQKVRVDQLEKRAAEDRDLMRQYQREILEEIRKR